MSSFSDNCSTRTPGKRTTIVRLQGGHVLVSQRPKWWPSLRRAHVVIHVTADKGGRRQHEPNPVSDPRQFSFLSAQSGRRQGGRKKRTQNRPQAPRQSSARAEYETPDLFDIWGAA